MFLSNSNGKIDVITGDFSYGRRFSGIVMLTGTSQGYWGPYPRWWFGPLSPTERQAIHLLSKGFDHLEVPDELPSEAFVSGHPEGRTRSHSLFSDPQISQ